jgi:2-polyprenyl-3-methyl-5-hydroxy-6-metoxy-1,4-benzoquinol methylase
VLKLDPIAAYDYIAPQFARLSAFRRAYLDQVEQQIVAAFPKSALALLDVGAGDGSRAQKIAQACGISRLVLVEPSAAMRGLGIPGAEAWSMRAEDLHAVDSQFDAITCLWNVLGHIHPAAARVAVLRQFARLLSREGLVFIDLNHRYNAAEYGVVPTVLRVLWDRIRPDDRNGDVEAIWDGCVTRGHVFTDREFRALAQDAGLEVRKRIVIHYRTGQLQHFDCLGNLLYVLAPSASQTKRISSS